FRGFNEAAPRWARKRRRAPPPRGRDGFNEAAPRWARKQEDLRLARILHESASMRPRRVGRGNTTTSRMLWLTPASFNEAAPRWARKQPEAPPACLRGARFNEAAPRWARKHRNSVSGGGKPRASMRPRRVGRGNKPTRRSSRTSATRFNEAAPRWARKHFIGINILSDCSMLQ